MTTAFDISEESDAARALRIIESMPAFAWSADAKGQFTYVSPSTLAFIGEGRDIFSSSDDEDEFGWRRIVHPDDYDRVATRWRHCLRTGDHYDTEHRIRRADGVYRWFRNSGRASRDNQGRITEWYGTTIDIDEQKQAEDALRRSELQLQQLIDTVPAIIWSMTPEGIPNYLNKRHTDLIGIPLKDLVATDGSRRLSLAHPDDRETLNKELGSAIKAGTPFVGRYRQRRANGPHRWVEARAEPLRDESGTIVQWYGVNVDIDDLVTAQEALRARERQLQQIIDTVPTAIWCATPEGVPSYLNKRATDVIGATLEDLTAPDGSRSMTIAHPDDRDAIEQAMARSFATGTPYAGRYRQRRANGPHRWVESRAEPLRDDSGNIIQWYGVSTDIHDLVTAQEALRENERTLRELIETAPARIWCSSPDGEPTYLSRELREFFGFDIDDIKFEPGSPRLSTLLKSTNHPDDVDKLISVVKQSVLTGEPWRFRRRQRRFDGEYRWVETHAAPMRDANGKIVQWTGVNFDIHDLVTAQDAIRQNEQRLQQMIDAVPVHILSFSAAGEPTYINKRYRDFLGLAVPHFDSLAEQQRALIHPDDFAEMYGTLKNCFDTGVPFLMRYRRRSKDGSYRWTEGRAEPLRDQEGSILQWYAVSLDIEDETRAQEALRQASAKLAQATQAASLAELSASIAHEVNQPLAAIVANSHACQRWLKTNPPNLERAQVIVERIIRDANSAADVVSHIRALFRQDMGPRTHAAFPSVIADARGIMAEEATRRRVRMDVEIENNLPLVSFDRVQIQQVLINLIRNGMEAMDSAAGDRILGMRVRRTGGTVQTEISDRGAGIEFPDKIFEAFFTTKEDGMGMGLAICRSIVESHGGRLWAEENKPQGATFIFTLPIEEQAAR